MNKILFFNLLIVLWISPNAQARDSEHYYKVSEAVSGSHGHKLRDVPFHFKGQKLPSITRNIGTWTANGKTRGVFRSDKESCEIAFISAMIRMQDRALNEGGNALVNLHSVTRNKTTESPTEYRCVAGATVVHVSIRGDAVVTQ